MKDDVAWIIIIVLAKAVIQAETYNTLSLCTAKRRILRRFSTGNEACVLIRTVRINETFVFPLSKRLECSY